MADKSVDWPMYDQTVRLNRCVVLVPVANTIEPQTQESLDRLAQLGYEVRTLRGGSQVDLARSTMATQAVRDGFDETLWVDSDTAFTVSDVTWIRSHRAGVVAGLYPCKGPRRMVGKMMPDCGRVTLGRGGRLTEFEYVGMGFTLVRREVYLAVAECLPECDGGYDGQTVVPYFVPMLAQQPGGRQCYLSEDYSFCIRARAVGYPPMVDATLKIGHVSGKKVYTWDDLAPAPALESVVVESRPSGEIVMVDGTVRGSSDMSISKQELLAEMASLDQQEAQHRETVQKAEAVKASAMERLQAVHGAKQVVAHLINKVKEHDDGEASGQATGGAGAGAVGTDGATEV